MVGVSLQEWFEKYLENTAGVRTEASSKSECMTCKTPLSSYLDAYYGKDPFEARLCTRCRRSPKR